MILIICDTAGCGKPKKTQSGTKTGNVFPEAIAMPQTLRGLLKDLIGCIPFSQSFFGFRQSGLIGFSC